MKRVWYIYRNYINEGQRDRGIEALNYIMFKTKMLPRDQITAVIQRGYYRIGEYKIVREDLKV